MEYTLGIDVGTTHTAAAVLLNGRTEVLRLGSRRAEVPSLVFVPAEGPVLIGEPAERRGQAEPGRLAREFKRRVGDPVPMLVGGAPYSAHAMIARQLEHVLRTAVAHQGGPPSRVVLTCPANWGPYKRELLEQAARLADLPPVQLRTEPEAAAIEFASGERMGDGDIIAVYDLGGGTFDAAVLRRTADGFDILGAPEGIEQLGGIDFDEAVFDHVVQTLPPERLAEPDVAALARLRRDCIEAKEALSDDTEVLIPVALPQLHTRVRLTRTEFEAMIRPALTETVGAVRRALRSAGVRPEQLRTILLSGGSSRIPLVSQLLSTEFDRPVVLDPHPEHSIALGAARSAQPLPRPAPGRPAPGRPTPGQPAAAQLWSADPVPIQPSPSRPDSARPTPALSGPALSGPALSGPALSGPALSGPALSGPANSSPANSSPANSSPANSSPANSSPVLSSPVPPDRVQSSSARPDPALSTPAPPGQARQDPARPGSPRSGPAQPSAAQSGAARSGAAPSQPAGSEPVQRTPVVPGRVADGSETVALPSAAAVAAPAAASGGPRTQQRGDDLSATTAMPATPAGTSFGPLPPPDRPWAHGVAPVLPPSGRPGQDDLPDPDEIGPHRRLGRRAQIAMAAVAVLLIAGVTAFFVSQRDPGDKLVAAPSPSAAVSPSAAAASALPPCGVNETFDGPQISPTWERTRPDAAIALGGSAAKMTAPNGSDIYPGRTNAPMLLRTVPGDFVMETTVLAYPDRFYQGAGLVLWVDENHYVRLELGYGDVQAIILEYRDGAKHIKVHPPHSNGKGLVATSANDVVLQLKRSGSEITAGWTTGDNTGKDKVRDLGTIAMDLPDTVKAGVAVLNQAQSGAKPKTFQATFYRVWFTC